MIPRVIQLSAAIAAITMLNAQPLRFTSGVVSNFSTVSLTLQGPSNQVCQVERLSVSSQVWQSMGTVRLSTNGSATFTTTLDAGTYGFYRSKTTNGVYRSTNAFGAVVGLVDPGLSMVGNPFGATTVAAMFPDACNDTVVHRYSGGGYQTSYRIGGAWIPNLAVGLCEGVMVSVPTGGTNGSQRYLVSGLFGTNLISRPIASGWSMLCPPRYQLLSPPSWMVDTFTTNRLGGYSLIPVQTAGSNPQCQIFRMINQSGTYQSFSLTTNNLWQTGGTNATVPLDVTEGFWIVKPTNATWYVGRTIC